MVGSRISPKLGDRDENPAIKTATKPLRFERPIQLKFLISLVPGGGLNPHEVALGGCDFLGRSLPRKVWREPQGALQIPPLRFATVGMTRRGRLLSGRIATRMDRDAASPQQPQVPPMRFATVGMTREGRLLSARIATRMDKMSGFSAATADPLTSLPQVSC
jgi:hypothetical protein